MKHKLIDTNIILRLLLRDNEEHYQTASHYFKEIGSGKFAGVVTPLIISECRYVLTKFYSIQHKYALKMLYKVVYYPNMHVEEYDECINTLGYLDSTTLDFADCYLLAKTKKKKYSGIITFDKKLLKYSS